MTVSVPIRRALAATATFAAFGLAVRFIGGTFDPDLRSWSLVVIAPLFGMAAYVRATGRDPYPPKLMIGFGVGTLLMYTAVFAFGGLPSTLSEWAMWAFVLSFPVLILVLGIRKLRRAG